MANLLFTQTETASRTAPTDGFAVIGVGETDVMSSGSVAVVGTSSVVLLIFSITPDDAGADETAEYRFTVDGSATGSPVARAFIDNTNEGSGTTMVWAVDGLSAADHTFAVEWDTASGTPATATDRPRSFQVIEFDTNATLKIDVGSVSADACQTAFEDMDAMTGTFTPVANSLHLILATIGIASSADDSCNIRFEIDAGTPTLEGPQSTIWTDSTDDNGSTGMMYAKTGLTAVSTTFKVQWSDRIAGGNTNTANNRTFQVIEFTDDFTLYNHSAAGSTAVSADPDSWADMVDMDVTVTPDSTDSVLLTIACGVLGATTGTDNTVRFQLADDGVREGPEIWSFADLADAVPGFLLAWAKTGETAETKWSLQWESVVEASLADTSRERWFQVIDFKAGGASEQTLTPSLVTTEEGFFGGAITTGAVDISPDALMASEEAFFAPSVGHGLTAGLMATEEAFPAATVTRGGVDISPDALMATEEGFFGPTITTGAVDLTPGLMASEEAFFGPQINLVITASLMASEETFFGPTVTVGVVTLTPALVGSEEAFFAPTVTTGAVTLTPSLAASEEAFFTPTVAPGTVTLTPPLVATEEGFFGPQVDHGLTAALMASEEAFFGGVVSQDGEEQFLTPALAATEEAFFGPSVGHGLTAALVASEELFFAATVSPGAVDLTPDLVASEEAFFSPTVTGGAVILLPSFVTSEESFFAPTVAAGSVILTPGLMASEELFFGPTVTTGAVNLTPSLVASEELFFGPTITTGAVVLTPALVASEESFFGPTITTGAIILTPGLMASEEAFFGPQLDHGLTAALVTTEESFFSPTITTGVVDLAPSLVASEETIFSPTVIDQSDQDLTPSFVISEEAFFAPTVINFHQNLNRTITAGARSDVVARRGDTATAGRPGDVVARRGGEATATRPGAIIARTG